jgi:hypothetical protein
LILVLRRARSLVHCARNCSDQRQNAGSALSRKRSGWSFRLNDLSKVPAALEEAQAKAWPGATKPALAKLVSAAAASGDRSP